MKKVQHIEKNVTSIKPNIDPAPQKPLRQMDTCVFCGKETTYPEDMHIDYRMYYIEGAGQLCKSCYEKVYKIKND